MHHRALYQGSLDYTLIFLCMNDAVARMKLLLALLISKYNLYGKICQFSFEPLDQYKIILYE